MKSQRLVSKGKVSKVAHEYKSKTSKEINDGYSVAIMQNHTDNWTITYTD